MQVIRDTLVTTAGLLTFQLHSHLVDILWCRMELALAELNTMSDHAVHDVCASIGTIRHLALPENALFESAKVQKVLELLEELLPAGHRVLLFSQWTQILDVLQDALQTKSYLWCRLDGGSKVEDRQSIIDEFNTNTSIGVFLISTRAGGVGINLTSADTVIIHDVDFNPQIDKQAQDRCHRVGQTKPVTVYRLVAQGTVDESVFECATRKEALANDALSGSNDSDSVPDKKEETREILRAMMQAMPRIIAHYVVTCFGAGGCFAPCLHTTTNSFLALAIYGF